MLVKLGSLWLSPLVIIVVCVRSGETSVIVVDRPSLSLIQGIVMVGKVIARVRRNMS